MSPEILKQSGELPLDPVLKTRYRTMRCSSLRPGHWLVPASMADSIPVMVILQSSKELRRVEIYQPLTRTSESFGWSELDGALVYGQGVRRWWHPLLPKWLQDQICPFTKPRKQK